MFNINFLITDQASRKSENLYLYWEQPQTTSVFFFEELDKVLF